jgi:choline dehydrogenase-like flavoprotein
LNTGKLFFFRDANVEPLVSPLCKSHRPWSDEYYKCVVQNNVLTVYHPVGTCKMGALNDLTAVVDSSLKEIGIQNLRVIDASVMPRIVGWNTNAATVMIGEKGVDMIIKEYQINKMHKKKPKDEL